MIKMVDVSAKKVTSREAIASAKLFATLRTIDLIKKNKLPKGDCLKTAQIAGILAAKKTANLIPLCHPISISNIQIDFKIFKGYIEITSCVKGKAQTGFEMEALVSVTTAALTIYDMAKQVDPAMEITNVKLIKKSGGKSGLFINPSITLRIDPERSRRVNK